MGYDLFVWPISAPITADEAGAALERMLDDPVPPSTDPRLLAFMADMHRRLPSTFPDPSAPGDDWEPSPDGPLANMDDGRNHVFLGIAFGSLGRVGRATQESANALDLVIFDPQAEDVYLPTRFGGEGVDWGEDPTPEERAAAQAALDAVIPEGAEIDVGAHPDRDLLAALEEVGGEMWSPMGFRLTEETIDDGMADPLRLPTALQTPEHKQQLLADLAGTKRRARETALVQLCGWDPDPEVLAALRPRLANADDTKRWLLTSAMVRQRAPETLDEVLEVVRSYSPDAGGTIGGMLSPLRDALELASMVGPDAVERVKRLARDWRGDVPATLPRHERDVAAEVDLLLG